MTPINELKKKVLALRDAAGEVYVDAVETFELLEKMEKQHQQPHQPIKTLKEKHLALLENNNWKRRKPKQPTA